MARGTSNRNARGNTTQRRRRVARMIQRFASPSGKTICCHWCRKRMRINVPQRRWEIDRVVCGHKGGTYDDANIVPACPECNKARCNEGCRYGRGAAWIRKRRYRPTFIRVTGRAA
jgi:hypothetical protein